VEGRIQLLEGIVSRKITIPAITILIAIVSLQFCSRDPSASEVNAVTLQQDLPRVSFDRASINVVEPDAGEKEILTLNVVISGAPEQGTETRVTALTANGNAIAGVDFEAISEHLTFPADLTEAQSFEIAIFGNYSDQPDRSFVAFLTNSENAVVVVPAAITINILDDDPPPPSAEDRDYLPIIGGLAAGPTVTPYRPWPTQTPWSSYSTSERR
jgi:hypothetical protein